MAKRDRTQGAASAAQRTNWVVLYHPDAVKKFEEFKEKKVRRAILTVVAVLGQTGPKCIEPHSKKIEGAKKLRELRPSGGQSIVRPIYFQRSEGEFIILAIGPEAENDASGFKSAVKRATTRAFDDFGAEV